MTELNNKNYEPNNYVVVIGNTGAEAEEYTLAGKEDTLVSLSLYTSNSYTDENGEFQEYEATRHDIISFDPWVKKELLAFKKGTRIRIQGKLTYSPFEVMIDGQYVKKREATIIAKKVETAILPSKKKSPQETDQPKELETA